MPAPRKQPHWRTRLHRVALLVNPANFFHATAASQIAFEAIAQAHYGAVFVVADALLVSEAAQVTGNLESQRRQYDLAGAAEKAGFASVTVIDDDLGRSGSGSVQRPSFERL